MAKKVNDSWLWHKKLGHVNMHIIFKLSQLDLVVGLPNLNFENDELCDACARGKHRKSSFNPNTDVTKTRTLQLLHINLFEPTRTRSLGGKTCGL